MSSATDFALMNNIELDEAPWGDLEQAILLIARRATEGDARTEEAKICIRLLGEALGETNGTPEQVESFIEGRDPDPEPTARIAA